MSNAPKAAAGWYPDEENTTRERYWDGERWTDAYRPRGSESSSQAATGSNAVTPQVLLLVLGGAAMIVAAFLPFVSSSQFLQVADNTLIQQGSGWVFLGLGLGSLLAANRAYSGDGARRGRTILIGLIGLGVAIWLGVSEDVRTLQSAADTSDLDLGGALDVLTREEVANPGIGVYVAGIGAFLTLLGASRTQVD